MPTSPPPEVEPAVERPPALGGRGLFVRMAIVLTALIFIGTMVVIYYRWVTVEEPNSVVVVRADEALEGAVVSVGGVALAEPLVAVLDERNRHRARFFLHPGSYTLRVELEGDLIYQQTLMLLPGRPQMAQIDLVPEEAEPG